MKRLALKSLIALALASLSATPAFADEPGVGETLINLA
jgi:hypothetical protein